MNPLFAWLRRPYPFDNSWGHWLRASTWGGVFVWLFLFFFKPFGTQIDAGQEWAYFIICLYFGLVTWSVFMLTGLFCHIFPQFVNEEGWVIGKEILFTIVVVSIIGVGNLLLANQLFQMPLTPRSFWTWQMLTFIVGVLPTTFGVFFGQIKLQKRYVAAAAALNQQVEAHHRLLHPVPDDTPQEVTLTGDNQGETLLLQSGQICYLAAADNYVQVFFVENGTLKSRMLRSTLRRMEDALASWPQFFRCHRTYLVNLDKVAHVSGNAQGYRLHLEGLDETIPVSRNLNDIIDAKFKPMNIASMRSA